MLVNCQFVNKTEITNMLGSYYDTSQIDGVIDQKYIFSNPGGNLNQRWIKLGGMNYPTNQLNDAKSIIFRIDFVQDITQDTDYYMLIQFKMSSSAFTSSVPQVVHIHHFTELVIIIYTVTYHKIIQDFI